MELQTLKSSPHVNSFIPSLSEMFSFGQEPVEYKFKWGIILLSQRSISIRFEVERNKRADKKSHQIF